MADQPRTAVEAVAQLGGVWAPGFDEYAATGNLAAVRCLMCDQAPCNPQDPRHEFASPAYLARLDEIHGKRS